MRMTVVSMLPVLFMLWRTLKPSTLSSVSTSRENLQQDTDQWLHTTQARAWQIATSIKVPGFEVSSNYPFTFSVVCGLLHGVDFSLLHEGYNIDVLTICVALSFLIQWHKNHWKRETQCKNKRKIRSSRWACRLAMTGILNIDMYQLLYEDAWANTPYTLTSSVDCAVNCD